MSSIPYGPTAGFSSSQAITIADSQSSAQDSQQSDSTTTSSHREDADMQDVQAYGDFINDDTQTSAATNDAGAYREPASYPDDESLIDWSDEEWAASQQASSNQDVSAPGATTPEPAEATPGAEAPPPPPSDGSVTPTTSTSPSSGLASSMHAPAAGDPATAEIVNNPSGVDSSAPGDGDHSATVPASVEEESLPSLGNKHYLDAECIHRINRQGYPYIPWNVIQSLAEGSNHPPSGQMFCDLPSWVNINKEHQAFAIRGAAMDAAALIVRNCPAPRDVQVSFRGGRVPKIVVSFVTGACLLAASSLRVAVPSIDNNPPFVLEHFLVGAELGARLLALYARHQGMAPATFHRKAYAACRSVEGLFMVSAHVVYHHTGPPPAPKSPTNLYIALLVFKPPPGGNYATPLTHEEVRSVPAWIDKYSTVFPGRFPACRGCKVWFWRSKTFTPRPTASTPASHAPSATSGVTPAPPVRISVTAAATTTTFLVPGVMDPAAMTTLATAPSAVETRPPLAASPPPMTLLSTSLLARPPLQPTPPPRPRPRLPSSPFRAPATSLATSLRRRTTMALEWPAPAPTVASAAGLMAPAVAVVGAAPTMATAPDTSSATSPLMVTSPARRLPARRPLRPRLPPPVRASSRSARAPPPMTTTTTPRTAPVIKCRSAARDTPTWQGLLG